MKKIIILLIITGCCLTGYSQSTAIKPFKSGDRVAFLGNSITHAGFYESYVWLYYMTHFPNEKVQIYNAGSGGDVAGQMNDRFEDDILRLKANVVVLTFGMNDSGYFEFWKADADQTAAERVQKSFKSFGLIQQKFKAHPEIKPIIMSSSPFDETTKIKGNNFAGKSKAIEQIVDFQEATAKKNNWAYIDLYHPMLALTKYQQTKDSSYTITGPDRIHPGKAGHLVMAALILKSQSLDGKPIADVAIDFKKKKFLKSENATSTELQVSGDQLSFKYLANSLPFPIDSVSEIWNNPQKQSDALKVYPFIKEFDSEIFQVKNLKNGDYNLLIDGVKLATFDADSFSKGVNIALLGNTPQYKQAKSIMYLNNLRAEYEGKLREYYWAQFNYFRQKGLLFDDSQKAYDLASHEKEGFIGSKMGVYQTARFSEVREIWENNMKAIEAKIYAINKPTTHFIQIEAAN